MFQYFESARCALHRQVKNEIFSHSKSSGLKVGIGAGSFSSPMTPEGVYQTANAKTSMTASAALTTVANGPFQAIQWTSQKPVVQL
jgi:hypothetical protein